MKYQANHISHYALWTGYKNPKQPLSFQCPQGDRTNVVASEAGLQKTRRLYFSHFLPFHAPSESVALLPQLPSIILSSSLSMIIIPHACYSLRLPIGDPFSSFPHCSFTPFFFVISDVHSIQASASSLGQLSLNILLISLPSFFKIVHDLSKDLLSNCESL